MSPTQTNPCEPEARPASEPFQYGDPEDGVSVAMSPGNSAPALIVWMFIVSNTQLQALILEDGLEALPLDCICKATNLTEEGVRTILRPFIENKHFQDACGLVAQLFQKTGGYEHGNCVTPDTLIHLAVHGAAVDPRSKIVPNYV